MRRGNGWEKDEAWQGSAGQKKVGGEREETAQGANGGKGTVRKISCGESWGMG